MRHFSDFERELIRIIVKTESTERQVFGELIRKQVFLSGKCALLMTNDEKEKGSVFFSKDTNSFKSNFAILVDVLALIKYLEKEGLVYLCEIPTRFYWLYADTKQLEQDKRVADRLYIDKENDMYLERKTQSSDILLMQGDRIIFRGWKMMGGMVDDLFHTFQSVVYPTTNLKVLVENNFVWDEEIEYQKQEERYRVQKGVSWVAIVVAFIVGIFSPFLSVLFGNCHGKTNINEEQIEELKNAITIYHKTDLQHDTLNSLSAEGEKVYP